MTLRVAVVGGGIGGLVAALTLLDEKSKGADLEVTIYEAGSEFSQAGVGLSFGPNAIAALRLSGLGEVFERAAGDQGDRPNLWYDFIQGEVARGGGERFGVLEAPALVQAVHRVDFLEQLKARLPAGLARFDHRLHSYQQGADGVVELHFRSRQGEQRTAEADVVIGADGIRSGIRAAMHQQTGRSGDIQYRKWIVWRGVVTIEAFKKAMPNSHPKTTHCGLNRHLLHFPVRGQDLVNIVGYVRDDDESIRGERSGPWSEIASHEAMLADYHGFTDECLALLKTIEEPSRWGVWALPRLGQCVDGAVVLIGDAAHATTPHCGAGAGQAVEDALFVARAIGAALRARHGVKQTLELYERIRHDRGCLVTELSNELGHLIEFIGLEGESTDTERVMGSIRSRMARVWTYDVASELQSMIDEIPLK